MSESAPHKPTLPLSPARRFGRTAVIVLVLSYVSAGLFFLVARFAGNNLEIHEVCSTFGITFAAVGTLWALFLAVRATAAGGSALTLGLLLLGAGCVLSYPLLTMWHSRQSSADTWAFLHYLCIPLIVPLATVSAILVLPLYMVLCRIFRRAGSLAPEKRHRATLLAGLAGVILFLAALPFTFVIYGSTMKGLTASDANSMWTVRAAKAMPTWIADRAFDFLCMLPDGVKRDMPETMASRGVLGASFYLPMLERDFKTGESNYGILRHFPEQHPEAAIAWTKTLLSRPAKLTTLDEELANVFAANASEADVRALLREAPRWQGSPKGIHTHILSNLWRRNDAKMYVQDVASISSSSPIIQNWRMNFLCLHADDDITIPAYAEFALNLSNAPALKRICWQLIRNQRWAVLLSALQRSNEKLCIGTIVGGLLHEYSGKRAFEKQPLPLALREPFKILLDDRDTHLATLAALVVLDSDSQFTAELEKAYCGKPSQPKSKSIDVEKFASASAEQNRAVIEKARAILQREDSR